MQMSELISLSPSDYPRFYEMALEYEQSGDGRYIKHTPMDNFMKFLSAIEDYQFEENCPDHIVPETWYWLENTGFMCVFIISKSACGFPRCLRIGAV
jgi:predicted acetyltransferase